MEQIQINCPATPITHAFVQFRDNDDRDKFVRSSNILKKKLRGRKIRCCIHTRHNVPFVQIKMKRLTKHVSVDGQIVIITCAND